MKKKLVAVLLTTAIISNVAGCGNRDWIDTNLTYNKAIINLQDGTSIKVDVKHWRDYEGEQLQIISRDGKTYLVSTFNCTLIRE